MRDESINIIALKYFIENQPAVHGRHTVHYRSFPRSLARPRLKHDRRWGRRPMLAKSRQHMIGKTKLDASWVKFRHETNDVKDSDFLHNWHRRFDETLFPPFVSDQIGLGNADGKCQLILRVRSSPLVRSETKAEDISSSMRAIHPKFGSKSLQRDEILFHVSIAQCGCRPVYVAVTLIVIVYFREVWGEQDLTYSTLSASAIRFPPPSPECLR
jgi:hypothetical protein